MKSPAHSLRMRVSVIILVGLTLLGLWFLAYQVLIAPPGTGFGPWFWAIVLLAGGIGGLVRIMRGARDRVLAMDIDEATGKAVLWLWSPLGARRIRTETGRLTNWRYVSTGGSGHSRFRRILADLQGRARPLVFDVRLTHPVPDGLRRVAPAAIADYEKDVGIA